MMGEQWTRVPAPMRGRALAILLTCVVLHSLAAVSDTCLQFSEPPFPLW